VQADVTGAEAFDQGCNGLLADDATSVVVDQH